MSNSIYNGTFVLGDVSATTLSAGNGIKITTDEPGVIKVSNDETVLWSGSLTASGDTINLTEKLNNFEHFIVEWKSYARYYRQDCISNSDNQIIAVGAVFSNADCNYEKSLTTWSTTNGTTYTWNATIHGSFQSSQSSQWRSDVVPTKIIGVNRKQNGGN